MFLSVIEIDEMDDEKSGSSLENDGRWTAEEVFADVDMHTGGQVSNSLQLLDDVKVCRCSQENECG